MTTNEPAFHVTSEQSASGASETQGVTLLDYFAAAALTGWLASYGENTGHPCADGLGFHVARLSYEMAESMLKRRAAAHMGVMDEPKGEAEQCRPGLGHEHHDNFGKGKAT